MWRSIAQFDQGVFDANSLGKWIYDWTVFCRGQETPITRIAGDLWLLLIELSGKIKHAENTVPRIQSAENKERARHGQAS